MEQNHLCNFGRGYYEEHFCENILNFDQWFRRYFLSTALASLSLAELDYLCNFGREHYGERSCKIILYLDQICHLKKRLIHGAQQMKTDHKSSP